jgi:glycosyltransferase involved in cell wall biosynthesis
MKQNLLPETLYISIDGIMEPLGYSQVFKYLEILSKDHRINLITFEKKQHINNDDALLSMIKKCDECNIAWHGLKYRSGLFGLGQLINIVSLIIWPVFISLKKSISIVHIRSYMPGIAIPFLSLFIKFKFIFDIRGFWADEKHDRLGWSKLSYRYKFFKILENYLIKKADYIVTLTKQSKDIIIDNFTKDQSRITVIPTCVDFQEIYVQPALEKPKNFIIGYLGSVDTAYDFSKFCFFISQIKSFKHEVELRIFTSQKIEEVEKMLAQNTLVDLKKEIKFLKRTELANELSQLDCLGFCLKENFSIKASMPTKIAEALSCGIPIICNAFNLDIEDLINKNDIGIIYNFTDKLGHEEISQILKFKSNEQMKIRCIKIAKTYFSINRGAIEYNRIYNSPHH